MLEHPFLAGAENLRSHWVAELERIKKAESEHQIDFNDLINMDCD